MPIRGSRRQRDDPEALRKIARVVIAMANRGVTAPMTPKSEGDAAKSATTPTNATPKPDEPAPTDGASS